MKQHELGVSREIELIECICNYEEIYHIGSWDPRLESLTIAAYSWRTGETSNCSVEEAESLRTEGTKDAAPVCGWRIRSALESC
jgi:hypothetical protein